MKITVPSKYSEEYVRPKKRSPETVTLRSTFEVEIREIDPLDAPVAHILGEALVENAEREPHVPFAMVDARPAEVRIAEGQYWVQRMPLDGLQAAVSMRGPGNPFNGFHKVGKLHPDVGIDDGFAELPSTRHEAEKALGEEMRKWESLRPLTASALEHRASCLAAIDGWLYEKVSEPAITLVPEEGRVLMRLTEAVHDDSHFSRGRSEYVPGYAIRFGVDEMEKAERYGEQIASRYGVPLENRVVIESHSPWHVRFRGGPEFLTAKAWSAMTEMSQYIGSMDVGLGKAWHDLMTALHEHDSVTAPAIDAMRRILALAGSGALGSLSRDGSLGYTRSVLEPSLETVMEGLEAALEVWDSRDSLGIEWLESGLGDTAGYRGDARAYEITSLMEADALSKAIGRDLSHMTAVAAAGRGSMVAVEDAGLVRAVCFVGDGDGGRTVLEAVAGHGADPARGHLDLALDFVIRSHMRRHDVAERDLEALGL